MSNTGEVYFYDPSDQVRRGDTVTPISVQMSDDYVSNILNVSRETPKLRRAVPKTLDYAKLSRYFAYRSADVIRHTLQNTTQLARAVIKHPMRRHLRSRTLMLRRKRLNEVVATDTCFSPIRSLEGYTLSLIHI